MYIFLQNPSSGSNGYEFLKMRISQLPELKFSKHRSMVQKMNGSLELATQIGG